MGEVHYMISEAAKRVNVETHVLRYWEEELSLSIGRTEMGHRYYTEDDIQLFCCIKELKEQGIQLKELKGLIPDMLRTRDKLKLQKEPKEDLLWSSIFVTLMANKIGGLQFGIYRNCQISSRVFHTAVAALPLTKANRSDFE